MCGQATKDNSRSDPGFCGSTNDGVQQPPKLASPLVILILVIHTGMITWGALRHSPTANEPAYLGSGLSHWTLGRFDLSKISPPLVRLVAALPVLVAQPQYDWGKYHAGPGTRGEALVGYYFLLANGERSFWLMTLGRWACIPFSLLGAWACYRWSMELFGLVPAVAALLLWCFSPNILAHAQLLTPDIGVTAFSLAACYAFWRWSSAPTWKRSIIAGGTLGLAVLAKTNAVALFPALVVGISLHALVATHLRTRRTAAQVFVAFAIALYVLNLGFGFDGSLRRLGDYEFFSSTLGSNDGSNRFRGTILESTPVPLPAPFLEGIDLQRRDFENSGGVWKSYLRGQWYDHGWWWYYFYVIAVKVPIGTWILVLIGGTLILFRNDLPHRIDSICFLVIPGVALFALACSQTGFSHSLRYTLPAFPFAFVVASAAMRDSAKKGRRCISLAALTWMLTSSFFIFPHSLSYFNELAGGPRNGHFHLLDGNVDFGQDVLYARDWIESHPDKRPIYTACWASLPLQEMGITFEAPDLGDASSIPSGYYLISVNHLRGEYRRGLPELAQFLQHEPIELVTYTLRVYHVP